MDSINAAAAYSTHLAGAQAHQAVQISAIEKAMEMEAQVLQLIAALPVANDLQLEGIGRMLDTFA